MDILEKMDAILDEYPLNGSTSLVIAEKVVGQLEQDDPRFLTRWLKAMAVRTLRDYIAQRERGRRSYENNHARRAALIERFREDVTEKRSAFEGSYVVDKEGTRKQLGQMTKPDHLFVAADRRKRGNTILFEASVHEAIAKRLPDDTTQTQDIISEEEYHLLREQLSA